MAIYLKKFETQAAYEAAQSGLILPNVSYTVDNNTVHYNPSSPVPPTPSHDFVEIGGIKWATMNIGATGVTDYGLYFQWGDTQGYTAAQVGSSEGQKYFGWADYKYSNNGGSTAADMTKYQGTGTGKDGLVTLDLSDDAARANWGGSWRMPTEANFKALTAATTNEWVTDYQGSGVKGRLFTDKNDPSKVLFFPAAGYCRDGSVKNVGSNGYCWSSSLYTSGVVNGRYLSFYSGNCYIDNNGRRLGCAVRGVVDE